MHTDGPIVVFDTNCILCSGMVAFVLAHEQAPVHRFIGVGGSSNTVSSEPNAWPMQTRGPAPKGN